MTAATCILSDGRPGHYNQSLGLVATLHAPLRDATTLALPAPRRALKNPVLLLAWLGGRLPALLRLAYRLYYGVPPPPLPPGTRALLSTGGDTLVANIVLARLHALPNAFLGKRSPFTDLGVALLFAAEGRPVPGRVVVLDFGPVQAPASGVPPPATPPALLAVLVGGDSTEYRYTPADYAALADALNALCARTGLRLLLTTSRRTGTAGEQALRDGLRADCLADATWYATAPRPVTRDYCTRADAILCTVDSGTMLTESLQFGRPVFACRPAVGRPTPFYQRFLDRLAAQGVVFSDITGSPGITDTRDTGGLAGIDPAGTPPARPPDLGAATDAFARLLARHAS